MRLRGHMCVLPPSDLSLMTPERETCSGCSFLGKLHQRCNSDHLTAKQRSSGVTYDDMLFIAQITVLRLELEHAGFSLKALSQTTNCSETKGEVMDV